MNRPYYLNPPTLSFSQGFFFFFFLQGVGGLLPCHVHQASHTLTARFFGDSLAKTHTDFNAHGNSLLADPKEVLVELDSTFLERHDNGGTSELE